jgi:hypothetical protein
VGELYFNFGWTGILVGMGVLGIWFRFLQDSFLRIDSTIPAMLAGIVAILTICPALEGDLLSPTNGVIFNVTPIILTHWLVSKVLPTRTVYRRLFEPCGYHGAPSSGVEMRVPA